MTPLETLLKDTQDKMDNTVKVLQSQLSGIRTGKASPALVENISVTYYGAPTRLRDLANISTPEARLMKEIDRLEMGLQASIYEQEGFDNLSAFFNSTDKALATPELRKILDALLKLRAGAR